MVTPVGTSLATGRPDATRVPLIVDAAVAQWLRSALISSLFRIDDRPFQAQVARLRAELAQAHAARERAISEQQRADRLAAENAISLEERERRAAASAEARARADAVAAALRAAELELEFTTVVSPIEGTPADRAGVQPGDFITAVDGESVMGLTLDEAVDLMRGPVGSDITITLQREGTADPFDVKITRETITISPVKSRHRRIARPRRSSRMSTRCSKTGMSSGRNT